MGREIREGDMVVSSREEHRSSYTTHIVRQVGQTYLFFTDGSVGSIQDYVIKVKGPITVAPNGPLREIAGRIKSLSYTDMMTLSTAFNKAPSNLQTADLILAVADALSKS